MAVQHTAETGASPTVRSHPLAEQQPPKAEKSGEKKSFCKLCNECLTDTENYIHVCLPVINNNYYSC